MQMSNRHNNKYLIIVPWLGTLSFFFISRIFSIKLPLQKLMQFKFKLQIKISLRFNVLLHFILTFSY